MGGEGEVGVGRRGSVENCEAAGFVCFVGIGCVEGKEGIPGCPTFNIKPMVGCSGGVGGLGS